MLILCSYGFFYLRFFLSNNFYYWVCSAYWKIFIWSCCFSNLFGCFHCMHSSICFSSWDLLGCLSSQSWYDSASSGTHRNMYRISHNLHKQKIRSPRSEISQASIAHAENLYYMLILIVLLESVKNRVKLCELFIFIY